MLQTRHRSLHCLMLRRRYLHFISYALFKINHTVCRTNVDPMLNKCLKIYVYTFISSCCSDLYNQCQIWPCVAVSVRKQENGTVCSFRASMNRRSLKHLVTHSITQSLNHSFIHSLNHSFTQSLNHSITPSFSHSITQSLQSLTQLIISEPISASSDYKALKLGLSAAIWIVHSRDRPFATGLSPVLPQIPQRFIEPFLCPHQQIHWHHKPQMTSYS